MNYRVCRMKTEASMKLWTNVNRKRSQIAFMNPIKCKQGCQHDGKWCEFSHFTERTSGVVKQNFCCHMMPWVTFTTYEVWILCRLFLLQVSLFTPLTLTAQTFSSSQLYKVSACSADTKCCCTSSSSPASRWKQLAACVSLQQSNRSNVWGGEFDYGQCYSKSSSRATVLQQLQHEVTQRNQHWWNDLKQESTENVWAKHEINQCEEHCCSLSFTVSQHMQSSAGSHLHSSMEVAESPDVCGKNTLLLLLLALMHTANRE